MRDLSCSNTKDLSCANKKFLVFEHEWSILFEQEKSILFSFGDFLEAYAEVYAGISIEGFMRGFMQQLIGRQLMI